MEKRKQASRTPNASRNTTARSMSERQGVRGLLNLAAAFGVREACFRSGLSHASMRFGIGRTAKVKSCFCFRFNANGPGGAPFRATQKVRCSQTIPSVELSVHRYHPRLKHHWDGFVQGACNSTFLFQRDYMDYHRDRFADHSMMVYR